MNYVDKIMSMTLNYNFSITQKFLKRIPAKPISCVKLRAEYKSITANLKCDCYFNLDKNSYPSPVLHSISIAEKKEITLPLVANTKNNDNDKEKDKLDINKIVQENANKLIELKKQLKNIEKSKKRCEDKISSIFDNLKVNELEIEIGILAREKTNNGYNWTIQI
jgi:hypothetical protein